MENFRIWEFVFVLKNKNIWVPYCNFTNGAMNPTLASDDEVPVEGGKSPLFCTVGTWNACYQHDPVHQFMVGKRFGDFWDGNGKALKMVLT